MYHGPSLLSLPLTGGTLLGSAYFFVGAWTLIVAGIALLTVLAVMRYRSRAYIGHYSANYSARGE